MSSTTADALTQEFRTATGAGSVEWAEANGEFVIWPTGQPCQDADEVREAILRIKAEDDFSQG